MAILIHVAKILFFFEMHLSCSKLMLLDIRSEFFFSVFCLYAFFCLSLHFLNLKFNKMKKLFAFVGVTAALLFAGRANAQGQFHLGYMPETITTENTVGGATLTTEDNMSGFFIGYDFNVGLVSDLNLNIGAQARFNFNSEETTAFGVTTKVAMTQILLDVPVLFNYGFEVSKDMKISLFLGPTFSYAVFGQTKTTVGNTETTAEWYGDDGDANYSRFSIYGTAGIAIDYSNFRLFGGYNLGLTNRHSTDGVEIKGSGLFVGLGFGI